jgi:hypothetical protein
LYADDFVLFVCPLQRDLQVLRAIFDLFKGASGLGCNIHKCHMAPIGCTDDQIATAIGIFPCQLVDFPIRYLGTPLSVGKLPRSAFQPLIDRMADKLPVWKGRLLHHSGQLILIKTTLTAVPIHSGFALHLTWIQLDMGHCGSVDQVGLLYTRIHHIQGSTICRALPITHCPLSWYLKDHYL